jgi:hypothetical protein
MPAFKSRPPHKEIYKRVSNMETLFELAALSGTNTCNASTLARGYSDSFISKQ